MNKSIIWPHLFTGDDVPPTSNVYLPHVKVTALRKYETLLEFIALEGLRHVLPGVRSLDDGLRIYHSEWTDEMIREHGIVAIEFVLEY